MTGAGSGIGRATALAFGRAGFSVILVGRRVEPLDAVAAEICRQGAEAVGWPCNVVEPSQVEALFADVSAKFGRLDVLFNNAGVGVPKASFEDIDLRHWKRVIDVNLTGAFLCAQQAFRLMKTQSPGGGRIINNGSVAAHSPRPHGAAYTASKHGVTGLTKSLSLDGRRYNIACGQIDIGNVATDAVAQSMTDGLLQANGQISAEPTMELDVVANAVLFMAQLPLEANVQFMTVIATKMPFIGRG